MKQFDKKNETKEQYKENRKKRIEKVLAEAGLKTEEDCKMYEKALQSSCAGYSLIIARDIDKIFVNNYNREWIIAWRGNMDIQVCLDFFAVITYITEYFMKEDTSTMKFLMDALKQSDAETLKEKSLKNKQSH